MDARDVIVESGTTTSVTSSRRKMQFRGKCSGFAETEKSMSVYHRYRQALDIVPIKDSAKPSYHHTRGFLQKIGISRCCKEELG
jgi:hypothetical protein